MECYLDNSATTPVCDEAIRAVNDAFVYNWGNPSSLYRKGLDAEAVLETARDQVSRLLSCRAEEIVFTSGGTESNNIALLGTANAMRRYGKRVIVSSVEHSSVYASAKQLESMGFDVVRLPVDVGGRVSVQTLQRVLTRDTILISVMAVNNEVGTIEPIGDIRRAVRAAGCPAVLHCDAVQAFGKLPDLKPSAMGVDMMSISSHKIHGPKGAGALYVRGGYRPGGPVRTGPRTFGGLQEKTLRPGTEPLPAIAGFGAAAAAMPDVRRALTHAQALRAHLLEGLDVIGGITVNSPADALPYIVNISTGINSEPMMNYLSRREVYVSSGSACAKGHKSHVLRSMGLSDRQIATALRVSFSHNSTHEEIDVFLEALEDGKRSIRTGR